MATAKTDDPVKGWRGNMRIIWWTERFWPFVGGIETLGQTIIPALQALGHEVAVVTSHSAVDLPDVECHDNIPIHRFHFLAALHHRNLRQLIATRQQLASFKRHFCADLVHIHFSGPSPLFHWQTEAAYSSRTLLSLHSLPMQQREQRGSITETSLQKADWVSGVSAHILRQAFAGENDAPSCVAHSSVIYNGLKPPSLTPPPLPNDPLLLCMGRMVPWKRFDWAIDLFAEIVHDYPTARLVLVGDGVEREALVERVAQHKLQARVTFTGLLAPAAAAEQISRSTLVLLPSTAMENIPYVAVEAGWLARPVIASAVSGLPEIIVDGTTGYLVGPTDKAAWLTRIRHLLDCPQAAQQLGEQACNYVHRKFALDTCVAQYNALYHQLGALP